MFSAGGGKGLTGIYERRATGPRLKVLLLVSAAAAGREVGWKTCAAIFGGRESREMKINCNSYMIMRRKLMDGFFFLFLRLQVRDIQNLLRAHFFQTG